MVHRNPLRVRNGGDASLVVTIKLWVREFELPSGADCEVVAINPESQPTLGIELLDGRLIVWINEDGSIYEVWRDGVRLD